MATPTRFLHLSVAAAIATILLKALAWWTTGSVGFLSDAMESFVNLAGAVFALWMVSIAREPADTQHPYGHGKAEYFSAGFEGLLILGAALSILAAAVERLLYPQALEALGIGIVFSGVSTAINFGVARILMAAAREHHSIALEGDSRHLMTDVWTSIGVIAAIAGIAVTGWNWLDPVIAIAVGLNILREAVALVRQAADGLMDRALPTEEVGQITSTLNSFSSMGIQYANLRTRRAGHQRFVTVDILVPGDWQVAPAHTHLDAIEEALQSRLPGTIVVTHLEPAVRQAPPPFA